MSGVQLPVPPFNQAMDAVASTYYHFIKQFLPSLAGQRLTVSVSGGVDSVALLHVASRFSSCFEYALSAIHFNHGLRPTTPHEEQSMLSLCEHLHIPCLVRRFLPEDFKQAPGTGVEEKARELRHQVYAELLQDHQTDWILLGHSRDDWEETVLFHFIRGCSPSHLSDALKHTDLERKILRPLLTIPKTKLSDYTKRFQLPTHEDETNQDTAYSRNKIRHQILPLIHQINPNFGQALRHFTEILSKEEEILEKLTIEAVPKLIQVMETDYCCLDKAVWKQQSPAIQLRLLRKLREHLVGNQRDFYYSQLISIQLGIMSNIRFYYEDKKMRIECTEDCIKARRQAINEE